MLILNPRHESRENPRQHGSKSYKKIIKKAAFRFLVTGGLLWVFCPNAFCQKEETPENLIYNSSLEKTTVPTLPDGWGGQSGWRKETHFLVDDVYVQGTKSMKLVNQDGVATPFYTANFGWTPGKAGTVYTFSVYLKSKPGGLLAQIGSDRLATKEIAITENWQRYVVTAPLQEMGGYSGNFIQLKITLKADKKGELYINAPQLLKGDHPVEYRLPKE